MKTRLLLTLALVLVLVLGTSITALAAHGTRSWVALDSPEVLTGTLTGKPEGDHWFATIDYPGNLTLVTVNLSYAVLDPAASSGLGLHLYGSDGRLLGQGTRLDNGLLQLNFASSTADQLVLHIFNYIDGLTATYRLAVQGTPILANVGIEAARSLGQAPAVAAPRNLADTAIPEIKGSLAGELEGSFNRWALFYPADTEVVLTMNYNPAGVDIARGVDLSVFSPYGEVFYASQNHNPNGLIVARFLALAGVRYEVVVANWLQLTNINYEVKSQVDPVLAVKASEPAITAAPAMPAVPPAQEGIYIPAPNEFGAGSTGIPSAAPYDSGAGRVTTLASYDSGAARAAELPFVPRPH